MPLAPRVAVRALPALALLLLIPASASASGSVRYATVDGTSLSCTSGAGSSTAT